jgi:enoyl-[acyl-carrier-protein] reductase (NADH)
LESKSTQPNKENEKGVDATALTQLEKEVRAIKDQMSEDSKYIKTKVDHVTTENVTLKKSVADMTTSFDKKITDLDGLMRSLMRGEMDEIDDKLKKMENEIGVAQTHQADQKVSLDSLAVDITNLKKLTNDMTKTLSEMKK